jgi:hypothetical protein
MKFLQNSSCGACRVAKVKCVHDPPGSAGEAAGRCVRCSRLDLDCVVEARRSKWDNKARPTPLAGLPAELASNPEYSRLIAELDKLRPIVEYEMKLHMYEKQVSWNIFGCEEIPRQPASETHRPRAEAPWRATQRERPWSTLRRS